MCSAPSGHPSAIGRSAGRRCPDDGATGCQAEAPGIGVLLDEGPVGLQLAAILTFSTQQYSRFSLTRDFATYSQAWRAIAHGHLDPVNRRHVIFVVARLELLDDDSPSPRERTEAATDIAHRLDAGVLGSRSGVNAWEWSPPKGTTHVTLP